MRIRHILAAAMIGIALALTACGNKPLLSEVSFSVDGITPNADGDADVLVIRYNLSRSAVVSIYFEDEAGNRYYFRDRVHHAPSIEGPYEVYFSGVVDGYTLPDDQFEGFEVEKRVLQDGVYTWTVEANDSVADAATERASGTLAIADADTALPELRGFTIFPPAFTPNRDSISDRVTINVDLKKDVDDFFVYLVGDDGDDDVRHYVECKEELSRLDEAGLKECDYDAGVDRGADPPPDGTYQVVMQARDAVGQWTKATGTLTIENGGLPRAYILNAEVEWSTGTIPLGQTLYFTLTVENDSTVPIRTSGPWPGAVYDSDQNYATLGEYEQSGVFRVGIHCETSPIDHPWRWAVGKPEDLIEVNDGVNTYYYLPAGALARVTGGIRFVDYVAARNPQYCYASLIHEDVEISLVNFRVDPVRLRIQVP